MKIQTNSINNLRPLHFFDGELGSLHSMLLEITELLMIQMEQTLHALDFGDLELAQRVASRDQKINSLQARIEDEVRNTVACNGSTANDLRTLMIISKMASTLENIGNEIVALANQAHILFGEHSYAPELTTEIIHIGSMIKIMLDKMSIVLETRNSNQAYKLRLIGWNCDTRLQQAVKFQLSLTAESQPTIEQTLNIMHILKLLERSAGLCRNIAEYQILMLDSIDLRRQAAPKASNTN